MAEYKCFKCGKEIKSEDLEKRFKCPHCDSKIFFKPRTKVKTVKAEQVFSKLKITNGRTKPENSTNAIS